MIGTRGHRIADPQRYQGRNSRRRVGRLLAVAERRRYNPGMRRPTRFSLAAFALLLVLLGAYTAYWLIIVEQIKSGVTAWAQAEKPIPCLGTTHADTFHGPVPVTPGLNTEEIEGDYERATGVVIGRTFAKLDPDSIPGAGKSAYEMIDSIGEVGGLRALWVVGSNPVVSAGYGLNHRLMA